MDHLLEDERELGENLALEFWGEMLPEVSGIG
jgi:hypothetical protein